MEEQLQSFKEVNMVSNISDYYVKKTKMLEYLGGKCVRCNSCTDLQIDHIDHLDKSFTVSTNWALSWDKLVVELDKCQLLCADCHLQKTMEEGSLKKSRTTQPQNLHGTVWMYSKRKCRCEACKAAKSAAMKEQYWRKKNRG